VSESCSGDLPALSAARFLARSELKRYRREIKAHHNALPVLRSWISKQLPAAADLLGTRVLQRLEEQSGSATETETNDPQASVSNIIPVLSSPSEILSPQVLYLLQPFLPPSHGILQRLFSSKANGHSFNRLSHHIVGYKGATLILIKDTMSRVAGILASHGWIDTLSFQGNDGSALFTLSPGFSVRRAVAASDDRTAARNAPKNFCYLNTKTGPARGGWPAKGMGAGGEAGRTSIWVDGDLEELIWRPGDKACGTFDAEGAVWRPENGKIAVVEVFGFGGTEAEAGVEQYRQRRAKAAERMRKVDRAQMFGGRQGWSENPDKFILDMAGITGASDGYREDVYKNDPTVSDPET